MDELQHLHFARDDRGVVTVTLDSPGRSVNVISRAMLADLSRVVDAVARDSSVRMLVLRSDKPKGFAAGADLQEVRALADRSAAEGFLNAGRSLGARLRALSIPTLALLQGTCVGGGLELAMYCRCRFAVDAPDTQLGLPETKLGLIPGWGGTQLLPEWIGPSRAAGMIVASELVSAREAARLGLVQFVWPPSKFDGRVARFLELAALPPGKRSGRLGFVSRMRWNWSVGRLRRESQDAAADNPSLYAAVDCIDAGVRRGWDAGLQAERDQFLRILFDPRSRQLLERFFTDRDRGSAP